MLVLMGSVSRLLLPLVFLRVLGLCGGPVC